MRKKVAVVLGTRPEAIKLAPVIRELYRHPEFFEVRVISTAQHRDMIAPIFNFFGLQADDDLDIMQPSQTLYDISKKTLERIEVCFAQQQPDMVLVQGDTSTAMTTALAAFYNKIPVGHVEAGLRSGNRYDPYPEEMNRRLIAQLASVHFAPTKANRENLLLENVPDDSIFITGNTVIDALHEIVSASGNETNLLLPEIDPTKKIILVTTHRRENFGEPQRNIFRALTELLESHNDIEIILPVHPNPHVQEAVQQYLPSHPGLHTIEPLDYISFIQLMNAAHFILTDSGGIQEEAPALGKPVLVLRRTTERNELLASGNGKLIGVEEEDIVREVNTLLSNQEAYSAMARKQYPFGEGGAAARIVEIVKDYLAK